MSHGAKVIAHSKSDLNFEVITLEVEMPRIVLAEFNTHRMFSRNSASSRAIPVEKMLKRVLEEPYIPTHWGKNQRGMQAEREVDEAERQAARSEWLWARDAAVERAQALLRIGIHKQITNRLLEPFMWHTVVVTTTEISNFMHLRNNAAAHPDIRLSAECMDAAILASTPKTLGRGEWHLPYVQESELASEELNAKQLVQLSTARCARVSYLTQDGKRELDKDFELHDRLLGPGHMSPLEHPCRPMTPHELDLFQRVEGSISFVEGARPPMNDARRTYFCGNFNGWVQYRKTIPGEHDIVGYRSSNP